MKYLQKTFSVPSCSPTVNQAEWDRIFGKKEKVIKREGRKQVKGNHRENA